MPAIAAFWTSSNEARPDTIRTEPDTGTLPSRRAQPVALSTALWRPTSSRTTKGSPDVVKMPAAWRPPVDSKTRCCSRSWSGNVASVSGDTRHSSAAGEKRVFSFTASRAALPQTPHEDVV